MSMISHHQETQARQGIRNQDSHPQQWLSDRGRRQNGVMDNINTIEIIWTTSLNGP